VDLGEFLNGVDAAGAVDERSLRIFRILRNGREVEQPLQFSAASQPRSRERRLPPGRQSGVSYIAEYPAGETPEVPGVSGDLAWIAHGDSDGYARYRLELGVPREGHMIQVPFPPQNLRSFDGENRAMPVRWFPRMQIRPQRPLEGCVHVLEDNRLVASYHVGPGGGEHALTADRGGTSRQDLHRPFIHPLIGPDGVSLTEFGKPHDPTGSHAHHYSLWIAHASVQGEDFWSETGGRILHNQLALLEDGPLFCRIVQTTRWVKDKDPLLLEKRSFTFWASRGESRLVDVELEFRPPGSEVITLGKTTFGFLSARVAQSMTVFDGGGEILNAHGDRNEQEAHLSHAEWLDQSGPVAEGVSNGIAILAHPENPRHPTGWHCRNDGWACASFNMDGAYRIEPGSRLVLRYRLVLHRHDAVSAEVGQRYREYASRPTVTWREPVRFENKTR
jgi:hypothetical protein